MLNLENLQYTPESDPPSAAAPLARLAVQVLFQAIKDARNSRNKFYLSAELFFFTEDPDRPFGLRFWCDLANTTVEDVRTFVRQGLYRKSELKRHLKVYKFRHKKTVKQRR